MAAVAGAKLFEAIGTARAKYGLENKALIARHREAIKAGWEKRAGDWIVTEDLNAADERLAKLLPQVMPSFQELGALVVDRGRYPRLAALLILDRLASRAEIFRPEGELGASATARHFALVVIEASLTAALDIPEYAVRLEPYFLVAIGQAIADIDAKIDRLVYLFEESDQGRVAKSAGISHRDFVRLARAINVDVDDDAQALAVLTRAVEKLTVLQADEANLIGIKELGAQAVSAVAKLSANEELNLSAEIAAEYFLRWKNLTNQHSLPAKETGLNIINLNIHQQLLCHNMDEASKWIEQRIALENGMSEAPFDLIIEEWKRWSIQAEKNKSYLDASVALAIGRIVLSRDLSSDELATVLGLVKEDTEKFASWMESAQ